MESPTLSFSLAFVEREERDEEDEEGEEDEDKGLRNLVLDLRKRERKGEENVVVVDDDFVRDRRKQRRLERLSSAVRILSLPSLSLPPSLGVEDIRRI